MRNKNYLVAEDYYLKNDISLTKLCKMFSIDRGQFSKYLKSKNIVVENKQNKTTIIEDYFEKIDTEEKAYWLGFLFADGNISKKSNNIEVSLKPSDIGHLKKFAKAINFSNPIIINKDRCRLCFANKKMKSDLIDKGCVPAKSLILKPPKILQKFNIHFIRGYFDGDGCISFNQGKHHRPSFSVLGTIEILNMISLEIFNKLKKVYPNRGSDRIFILSYSGEMSRIAISKIYNNATIFLDRKFQRYNLMKIALQDRNVLNALSKYGGSPK